MPPRWSGAGSGRVAAAPLVLVLGLAVGTAGCHRQAPPDEHPGPRNLLWIVVDTLRADRLSCYGGAVATPAIDALAASGVRFERAYTHIPITGPSHATMFTGRLPLEHGVRNNTDVLPPRSTTIAEIFEQHGFRTAAVVSLGNLSHKFGFAQGFQHFDDRFSTQWFRPADEITDAALAAGAAVEGGPFFLFVHYSDPHEPYSPPTGRYTRVTVGLNGRDVGTIQADGYGKRIPVELRPGWNRLRFEKASEDSRWALGFRRLRTVAGEAELPMRLGRGWRKARAGSEPGPSLVSRLPAILEVENPGPQPVSATLSFFLRELVPLAERQERYDGEIAYADQEIGRLLAALEARGDLDDTLIVFTSDHGEGMGDHGLVGHVQQLYDSLLHVPLILTGAGIPAPAVEQDPVGLEDLLPTLLGAFAMPTPPGLPGRRLLGAGHRRASPLLAMTFRPEAERDLAAVRSDRYKLIVDLGSEKRELYDLLEDPGEMTDIHAARSDLDQPLVDELSRALATPASAAQPGAVSERERELLEALGYSR